jgi:hypothetical protein
VRKRKGEGGGVCACTAKTIHTKGWRGKERRGGRRRRRGIGRRKRERKRDVQTHEDQSGEREEEEDVRRHLLDPSLDVETLSLVLFQKR